VQHLDDELDLPDVDVQHIAHRDGLGRLDAHLVEQHLAALDRIGRQRTRLVETRRPQPLVDAEFFGAVFASIFSI